MCRGGRGACCALLPDALNAPSVCPLRTAGCMFEEAGGATPGTCELLRVRGDKCYCSVA